MLVRKKLAGVKNICEYAGKVKSHPGRRVSSQFSGKKYCRKVTFQPCRPCSILCASLAPSRSNDREQVCGYMSLA